MLTATMLAAVTVFASGCLVNSHQEKIVGEDVRREPVDFENDAALRIFTEAVKDQYPHRKDQGKSRFGIPFVISASERRVLSENIFFNQQVDSADLNGDDEISEAEARAYAGQWD